MLNNQEIAMQAVTRRREGGYCRLSPPRRDDALLQEGTGKSHYGMKQSRTKCSSGGVRLKGGLYGR